MVEQLAVSTGTAAPAARVAEPKVISPLPWMRQHVLHKARMASIHDEEIRALCCSFICNAALLMWQLRLPQFQANFRSFYPWLFLLLGVLQYEWHVQHPASFLRFRPYIRICNRVVRAAVLLKLPFAARAYIRRFILPGPDAVGLGQYQASMTPLHPAGQAVKHLGVFTGSLMLLAHAVHTTFRPRVQAAVQAALAVFLVAWQVAPATAVLRVSGLQAQLRGMCSSLNMVVLLAQADVENYAGSSSWLDALCEESAEEVLAVFATLYLGLVVPVYLAVRMEARRRQFLLQELLLLLTSEAGAEGGAGGEGGAASPHPGGVGALGASAEEGEELAVLETSLLLGNEGLRQPLLGLIDWVAWPLLAVGTWGVAVYALPWLRPLIQPL